MTESHRIFSREPSANRLLPLRHKVLREGMPIESARFVGDDDLLTLHMIASLPGKLANEMIIVCCASFMYDDAYKRGVAFRLRGMATDPEYQRHGIGGRLLSWTEGQIIDRSPIRLMWCNARVPAIKFYERNGWECVSDEFEIPTAGPHREMIKRL